jgi:hypothetical protein
MLCIFEHDDKGDSKQDQKKRNQYSHHIYKTERYDTTR